MVKTILMLLLLSFALIASSAKAQSTAEASGQENTGVMPEDQPQAGIRSNLQAKQSLTSNDDQEADAEGGSGYVAEYKQASAVDYKALISALRAGCASPQTSDPLRFPTAVVDLDVFFIIPAGPKANWLPPRPTNPNSTIKGVDADGDCVRDDIEYYIAKKYRKDSQYKLRKYLYEYAAWMDRFLISNISVNTAKTSSNNMAAAGECVRRIIGDNASRKALSDLFAKFHNTFPRSRRYLDNILKIGGWTTRENISVSCP